MLEPGDPKAWLQMDWQSSDECCARQTNRLTSSRHIEGLSGLQTESICLDADTWSRAWQQPGRHEFK